MLAAGLLRDANRPMQASGPGRLAGPVIPSNRRQARATPASASWGVASPRSTACTAGLKSSKMRAMAGCWGRDRARARAARKPETKRFDLTRRSA
jgi:hypothetical protein